MLGKKIHYPALEPSSQVESCIMQIGPTNNSSSVEILTWVDLIPCLLGFSKRFASNSLKDDVIISDK